MCVSVTNLAEMAWERGLSADPLRWGGCPLVMRQTICGMHPRPKIVAWRGRDRGSIPCEKGVVSVRGKRDFQVSGKRSKRDDRVDDKGYRIKGIIL